MDIEDFSVSLRTRYRGYFLTTVTQFSSTVSEAAVVYDRRRCHRQQLNWASWMIFRSQGPSFRKQFLSQKKSMHIEDFSVRRRTGFRGYFCDNSDSVFINSFSVSRSLCAQKMSASAVELGFLDDFWVLGS